MNLDAAWNYAMDNPRILKEGMLWYPTAKQIVDREFPGRSDRYNLVAIAAWNNTWEHTIAAAHRLANGGSMAVQRRVLSSGLNPKKHMKTIAFRDALSHSCGRVVIDRWMKRIMGINDRNLTYSEYYGYADVFTDWVVHLPMRIRTDDAQAVVWLAAREMAK